MPQAGIYLKLFLWAGVQGSSSCGDPFALTETGNTGELLAGMKFIRMMTP